MKRLIPWISKVADSSQARRGGRSVQMRVPCGYVPVIVGDEMERFTVRAEILACPAFAELLRLSAQEYGYEQVGVLRIPCTVDLFRRVLLAADDGNSRNLSRCLIFDHDSPAVLC